MTEEKPTFAGCGYALLERLLYIELMLYCIGEVSRRDIVKRFDVEGASATRDLRRYNKALPGNAVYDRVGKTYVKSDEFEPFFDLHPARVLAWIENGQLYGAKEFVKPLVPLESPSLRNEPDPKVLSALARAIHHGLSVEILAADGQKAKPHGKDSPRDRGRKQDARWVIVPHALADDGFLWQVRAFDRPCEEFRSIPLRLIKKAEVLEEEVAERELPEKDRRWNNFIDLHLVVHPDNVPDPLHARSEFMEGKDLRIYPVRAPLAASLLRRWNVDCTRNHSLAGPYPLWLMNPRILYGVEDAETVPGYEREEEDGRKEKG